MTRNEIREVILEILEDIAPDEDLSDLKDDVAFRDQSILSPRIASTRSRMCPRRNWYVSS